jgi:spore germination protein YaaH
MKPETKLVLFIFVIAVSLGFASRFSNKEVRSKNTLTPFAQTLDILSMFSNKNTQKPRYTVYGYLPYWSIAEHKNFQYDKLTDIAYFGLYLNKDGSFRKYSKLDDEDSKETAATTEDETNGIYDPGYNNWINNEDLNKIIQKGTKNQVRFALTIISHDDEISDAFLDCEGCWKNLLVNIGKELDSKEITDINLNFEYAAETDEDKAKKFLDLTKYLNTELDKIYGDSKVIVTAFADSVINPRVSSEVAGLGRYSDGIFVMAYDFHTPNSEAAGPVAPVDKGSSNSYDLRSMIRDYLTQVPPNKLILGVPYYGYNWVVEKEEPYAKRIPGDDDIGHSKSQPYARIMDILKGNIEEEGDGDPEKNDDENDKLAVAKTDDKTENSKDSKDLKDTSTNKEADKDSEKVMGAKSEKTEKVEFKKPEAKWDEIAACPYFTYINPYTKSIRQVYYEDEKSLKIKYDLVKENKLLGVGVWALGYDGIYNELWNQIYESFIKAD